MTTSTRSRWPTINGVGVLVLGGAAFVLSYDTLYRLALRIGFPRWLAWLWPLIIDGFIVYASDEALHRARTGKRWQAAYAWLLVLCATGGSAAFQVATAPPTLLSRIGHAVPPVALLLAFEIRRRRVAEQPAPRRPAPQAVDSPPKRAAAPARKSPTRDPQAHEHALRIYQDALAAGRPVTGAELAAAIGTSDRYGRLLLAKFRKADQRPEPEGQAR
jgi:hypothetical protein